MRSTKEMNISLYLFYIIKIKGLIAYTYVKATS